MDSASPQAWAYCIGNTKRTDGEPVEVRACCDDSLVGTTFRTPDEAIEEAVTSVVNAFKQVSCLPAYERVDSLTRGRVVFRFSGFLFRHPISIDSWQP